MSDWSSIAVVGPDCTGKTYLADALSKRFGMPLLPDPRRDVLEASGCHTLFEAGRFRDVWRDLLELQLQREAQLDSPGVLDTCAMDYWVQWQRWSWCSSSVLEAEDAYSRTRLAVGKYRLVVRMPAQQLPHPAAHRFINPTYAVQISRLIGSAIAEMVPAGRVLALSASAAASDLESTLALVQGFLSDDGVRASIRASR